MSQPTAVGPQPVLNLLRGLSRGGDWITLVLLLSSLLAAVWSVEAADWVVTPSLPLLMVGAVLVGWRTAGLQGRFPWWHPTALLLGVALAYGLTAASVKTSGWPEIFQELNSRLAQWWEAANGGGISSDTIPFALGLAILTWLTGYISAWAVFRRRNLWLGVLPGAWAIVTNLSYLPDRFLWYLYLYLFATMLLAVYLTILEREEKWRHQGIPFRGFHAFSSLHYATWFIGGVFLVALLLPVSNAVASGPADTWNRLRQPMVTVQDEFGRLFSAVPARKAVPFRNYGAYLPFQGSISLGKQTVFYVESPEPGYWRSRVYSVYTPQGWIATKTQSYPLEALPPFGQERQERETSEVSSTVTLGFTSVSLPVNAFPLAVDVPVEVDVQAPRSFWLSLDQPEAAESLPEDLRGPFDTLVRLRAAGLLREGRVESLVRFLPDDVQVTRLAFRTWSSDLDVDVKNSSPLGYLESLASAVAEGRGSLAGLLVQRVPPAPPDILRIRSDQNFLPDIPHAVVSQVSSASPEMLRTAGTNYPNWVTDTYLQLPNTLPQRVRELAEQLTADAPTPYDKALAFQNQLKTFTYDQKIPTPPFDADGVDYFLFTSQRGYSDYFGSSMTVLLRAVGIPARLVAGHSTGVLDEGRGVYVVRDLDSHAWPEAYFPGYGWIEFEPTPGFRIPSAPGVEEEFDSIGGAGDGFAGEEEEDDLLFDELERAGLSEEGRGSLFGSPVTLGSLSLVLVALLALGGGWYLYRRVFVEASSARWAFDRMCTLASLIGVGPTVTQTPGEYSRYLARLLPEVGSDVVFLGDVYARVRYGVKKESTEQEFNRIARAWRRVRRLLLRRLAWRYLLLRRTARP